MKKSTAFLAGRRLRAARWISRERIFVGHQRSFRTCTAATRTAGKAWIAAQDLNFLFVSVVSFGEWRKGITLLEPGRRRTELESWLAVDLANTFSNRILPLTQAIAERWGILEAQRQQMGSPLSVPDGQIAATAIEHGLVVVTRNDQHFADLGATIVNPWDQAQ